MWLAMKILFLASTPEMLRLSRSDIVPREVVLYRAWYQYDTRHPQLWRTLTT